MKLQASLLKPKPPTLKTSAQAVVFIKRVLVIVVLLFTECPDELFVAVGYSQEHDRRIEAAALFRGEQPNPA